MTRTTLVSVAANLACACALADTSRVPWELGRFVRQAAFFNAPRFGVATAAAPTDGSIWSASAPQGIEWGSLDDVVMGGASRSEWRAVDGRARFSGTVTTANNGGFAGVRTRPIAPPRDLSSFTGLVARVRGDGNRYKFIVRDDNDWNGIAWTQSFDTSADGKFRDVKLPFSEFVPTLYAKTATNARPLDTASICAVQLTLSKFEYDGGLNPNFQTGAFCLDVEQIRSY